MSRLDGKTRLLTMPRLLELLREERAKTERLEKALLDVAARAAFEQSQPSGLHMTAFSLIEKAARAALKTEGREG